MWAVLAAGCDCLMAGIRVVIVQLDPALERAYG